MIAQRSKQMMMTVATLALLAAPTWANGRGGFEPPRPLGGRGAHPAGLLGQLIFPCQAACADTSHTCTETADSAALTCTSAACATEIDAAQTACADTTSTTDCRTAVRALAVCATSCLDTRSTALETCRTALNDCRDACETGQ